MIRVKKLLYPTDFSSYSNQAYFHAVALAESHQASLTALFVYTPDMVTPGQPPDETIAKRYWQNQLEQIRPINPGIVIHHVLLVGDPAREIVRFGRDASMDLIVMGTHGRTGLERLLLGSVAEHVMKEASCSVLVVKLPRGVPATEAPEVTIAGAR